MTTDGLAYPEFLSEREKLKLDQALNRIAEALKAGEAQFLFGAGMSQSSDVPGTDAVVSRFLKDYFTDRDLSAERLRMLGQEYPFEALLEVFKKMPGSERDFTRKLAEQLLDPKFEPSQAHKDFLSLCWGESEPRVPVIFTTNFDLLLEQQIGFDRSVTITETKAKEINQTKRDGKIPVIHLRGILEDGDYQATESELFTNTYHALYYEFEVALYKSDAFVFVGYSMKDPDLRHIYLTYRDRIRNRDDLKRDTFVVNPVDDWDSYDLGKAIWQRRGAIWFPIKAELFFAKLKQAMLKQEDTSVRRSVMEKYHLGDDEVLKEHIERASQILRISQIDGLQFLGETMPRGGGGK